MPNTPQIAIIGGGASALYIASILVKVARVHIYEQNASLGKKYLVAGKGGFNISHHHADMKEMASKYTPSHMFQPLLEQFSPNQLREWYASIGIETFVGSSGRIFPTKDHSPGDVLRSIKKQLSVLNVKVHLKHAFIGFDSENKPKISSSKGIHSITPDFTIFCLGGGSWKVTGANSGWHSHFERLGISILPYQPSNCGLNITWPDSIKQHHTGKPLKNLSVTCNGLTQKGEAVITNYGLEGNAIYPISSHVRNELDTEKKSTLYLNLKPHNSSDQLLGKIRNASPAGLKKQLGLNGAQWALFKQYSPKECMQSPQKVVHYLQNLPIPVESLRPIEEAISTVGGIDLTEIDANLALKKLPNTFVTGEMLNWDAPTGGYLLHGCFAMAHHISKYLTNKTTQ